MRGDVLLLLLFLLGCLDGDGVEGDLDLGGVVEAELRRCGDWVDGGGGRAPPLKGNVDVSSPLTPLSFI